MLCRVYGTAFPKASMLEEHLAALEEAKSVTTTNLAESSNSLQQLITSVRACLFFFQRVQNYSNSPALGRGRGRKERLVAYKTPLMAKSDLYKISGHWDHYKEGMFVLGDEEKDKEVFALRPMTCPFSIRHILTEQDHTVTFRSDMTKHQLFSVTRHRAKCTALSVFVSLQFQRVT